MAPVVVVEFSDFGCPYCARFALESLPVIEEEYIRTGQVRWQYVPFTMGIFPNGEEAAARRRVRRGSGRLLAHARPDLRAAAGMARHEAGFWLPAFSL
jgi:hypothetical protein